MIEDRGVHLYTGHFPGEKYNIMVMSGLVLEISTGGRGGQSPRVGRIREY